MPGTVSVDFLLRVAQATPEQQAAIERFLASGSIHCTQTRFLFARAGRHYRVVFDGGAEFHLDDTLGARYLDYLLHHPNQPISAFDLEVAVTPEKKQARGANSIARSADPETVRTYLRELTRLRGEREQAEETGQLAAADRLDGEILALETALRGSGCSGDAGERARNNVSKAMGVIRRELRDGCPSKRALGEHLERFLSVGYQCMYAQAPGESWA